MFVFFNRYNSENGPNWIVNRSLQAHNSSKWTLNGKATTETAVYVYFYFEIFEVLLLRSVRSEN